MMRNKIIVSLILACSVGATLLAMGYNRNNKFNFIDNSKVVEASSVDYVAPYEETEYEDVEVGTIDEENTSTDSDYDTERLTVEEVPEELIIEEIDAEEVPDDELVIEEIDVAEVPETEDDVIIEADDKDVVIEYVSRADYDGEIPNEMNDIIIAMYHGIGDDIEDSDTVHRNTEGFKKDLQTMYDYGYRPITMKDLMTNNIDVPEGYTPIVLTFDDGLSSQLSMSYDEDGNAYVDEGTVVDIINDFHETHPDFETHGLFYVYTSQTPFRGEVPYAECGEYLLANGYEIGCHTYSHPYLGNLSATAIERELAYGVGGASKGIDDFYSYDVKYMAYPYGSVPKDDYRRSLLLNGTYDGFTYNFQSAVLAAPNLDNSSLIYSNDFDPLKIGRYRGTDNATLDLNWKFRNDEKNPDNKFISDGDPDTVTILEEDLDKVNLETLDNKTLRVITD